MQGKKKNHTLFSIMTVVNGVNSYVTSIYLEHTSTARNNHVGIQCCYSRNCDRSISHNFNYIILLVQSIYNIFQVNV